VAWLADERHTVERPAGDSRRSERRNPQAASGSAARRCPGALSETLARPARLNCRAKETAQECASPLTASC
jgi:hypothetical protein